ncbi:phosphatase PAP2 family protein [Acetobacter sp. LMG 1627]|uniref:Phosphatase PAP2 family protein n=1 Tax=Acetobacter conturbans TaxID=1737472 RepID=A0ABX0JYD2_9PROT|nr:phosphatase PAP2 family protein [Acetobacter conturbans]
MLGTISDFADQAVVGPIEITVFLVLLLLGRTRDGLVWGAVMLSGSLTLCVLKLWFERCGVPVHRILYSPSGHTFGGTMVYGGLFALFCRRTWGVLTTALMLAVLFGASRILSGVHTAPEAVLGGIVGVTAVGLLHCLLGRARPQPSLYVMAVVLGCVVVLGGLLHGYRLGAEVWLEREALVLGDYLSCHRT